LIHGYLGGGFASLKRRAHRAASFGRRRFELYLQLDDPYAHLLVQAVQRLVRQVDCQLDIRVVPAPVAPFDPEPQLRLRYAMADARDLAARFEIGFPSPAVTPVVSRLTLANRILLRERPNEEQLALALLVGEALWSGADERLRRLSDHHGAVDEQEAASRLEANRAQLLRRGHFQGGSLRYLGEWYVGIDRLGHLEAQLQREGLEAALLPAPRRGFRPPRSRRFDDDSQVDLYFSFRSPYSYLALERMAGIARARGATLRIKPVLPMVTRGYSVPLAKRLYIVRDAAREARALSIPFGRICDPLGVGVERCMAVFVHAEELGRGLDFAASAARGIWSEALDVARDGDLRHVVRRAGLDWSAARACLADEGWRDRAERNRHELRALGLWGVPSFRVGDWACWGQDRLGRVDERLAQASPDTAVPSQRGERG